MCQRSKFNIVDERLTVLSRVSKERNFDLTVTTSSSLPAVVLVSPVENSSVSSELPPDSVDLDNAMERSKVATTLTTKFEISDLQEEEPHEFYVAPLQDNIGPGTLPAILGVQTQVPPEPLALLDVTMVAKTFPHQF